MNSINEYFKSNSIKKINDNLYQIESNVNFNGFALEIYLKRKDNEFYLSDNQSIIKYMQDVYNLGAIDVKKCINSLLMLYGYSLSKGEIFKKIENSKNIKSEINNLIMLAGQLAFMFVFFE